MLESANHLAKLTGFDRETVCRRLDAAKIHFERDGDHATAAKLYETTVALPILYGVDPDNPGEKITAQEASRRLTIAREKQVVAQTEVTCGDRLHREDIGDAVRECFGDIAAIIKSRADALGREAVSDAFQKMRECGEKLCIAISAGE